MRLILSTLFLFSSTALADFNGSWSGAGTAYSDPGTEEEVEYTCPGVKTDIEQTAATLTINKLTYDCLSNGSDMSAEWSPSTYTISGNDLMLGDAKVGTITDTKIEFYYYNEEATYKLSNSFELQQNGSLKYSEKDEDLVRGTVGWTMDSDLYH